MVWQEWSAEFLSYLRVGKRYSSNTVMAYESDITQFRKYLFQEYGEEIHPQELRHYHVRSWLAGMKEDFATTASTINRKRSTLLSLYKFLMQMGYVDHSPAKVLHPTKKAERVPTVLKMEDAKSLVAETDFPQGFRGATERLICEMLYDCGMRRAELIGLQEIDVEWGMQQLRVLGKGNKERLIPISTILLDALRDYIALKKEIAEADRSVLLITEKGLPLYPNYVYRVVTGYLRKLTSQKKVSPHVLRHSFATHLLANGADIQTIKELLGHSSLASTQVYTHNSISQLQDVHRKRHPRG